MIMLDTPGIAFACSISHCQPRDRGKFRRSRGKFRIEQALEFCRLFLRPVNKNCRRVRVFYRFAEHDDGKCAAAFFDFYYLFHWRDMRIANSYKNKFSETAALAQAKAAEKSGRFISVASQ
jgi:hypothetical protein